MVQRGLVNNVAYVRTWMYASKVRVFIDCAFLSVIGLLCLLGLTEGLGLCSALGA